MTKKPHVAFTPQEELTAPMPFPVEPVEPNAIPIVVAPIAANEATVRITPPGTSATGSGRADLKVSETIEGVKGGELKATPKLFSQTKRSKRTTPYSSVLDPIVSKIEDEDSIVVAIDDVPEPIRAETSDGTVAPIDAEGADRTAATAVPTLNIEHRATVLYWLVNLAREQGLVRSRAKSREEQDLLHLVRVMKVDEKDLPLNNYRFGPDKDGNEDILSCTKPQESSSKSKKLHSIELMVLDWPRFERWVRQQHEERFRDMVMLDMLDSEIRIASWTYLDWLVEQVEAKSVHGHSMFTDGQPTYLMNL